MKKGYYPAQLLSVKPYEDKDHNLVEGTYGHQLIFEFAIFEKDENDRPVKPMMFKEEGKDAVPVKIPKFVYHEYKDKDRPGEFQTAITPKSAITGVLQALGWVFSEEDVDIEPFLGNWVEVNINDYKTKDKDGTEYTSSSINDVGPYANDNNKGEVPSDLQAVPASKAPESVNKQMKHEEVKKADAEADTQATEEAIEDAVSPDEPVKTENAVDPDSDPKVLKEKIENLNQLHRDGHLTDEGHKQATEQLQAKLYALNK